MTLRTQVRRAWIGRIGPVGLGLLFGLSGLASAGCAETAKQAARSAAPAAAEGTLDAARKPDNRQDIATIIGDPQIREASKALAGSVADGVFDALTDEERTAALERLSARLVEHLGPALAKTTMRDLRPAMSAVIAESVDQTMARLLSDENRERAGSVVAEIAQSAVRGMSEQIGNDVARLGATPDGTAEAANLSLLLARNAGRGVALGIQDAVSETTLRREQGQKRPGEILALAGQAADLGVGLAAAMALALIGGAIALCAILAWLGWRARNFRRESERREDALLMLARVIKSTENAAWAQELHERIRDAARDDTAGNTLREVLHRHGNLRLRQNHNGGAPSARMHDA